MLRGRVRERERERGAGTSFFHQLVRNKLDFQFRIEIEFEIESREEPARQKGRQGDEMR